MAHLHNVHGPGIRVPLAEVGIRPLSGLPPDPGPFRQRPVHHRCGLSAGGFASMADCKLGQQHVTATFRRKDGRLITGPSHRGPECSQTSGTRFTRLLKISTF